MNNIKLVVLCAVFVSNSCSLATDSSINNRISNYVKSNRLQNAEVLQDYDTKLEFFRKHYLGRIETLNLQLDMTMASIGFNDEFLNPFALLGNLKEYCVTKYRSLMLTESYAKMAITGCILHANSPIESLLISAIIIRNVLKDYYENYFVSEMAKCRNKFHNEIKNYTRCVTDVAADAIDVTTENQKIFETQLNAAECSAKLYIKSAFDCTYKFQSDTLSLIAETSQLIANCIEDMQQCVVCDEFSSCRESFLIDPASETFINPFYNRTDNPSCATLEHADYYNY